MAQAQARWMERALELAQRGSSTSHPNPRVGCVIVRDGECVGEGWHEWAGEPHAEVNALRAAGERARGAELYVTLEPCCHVGRTGPCADAILGAGVKRVVAAMRDPNPKVAGRGILRLEMAGVACEVGLLEPAARDLNRGFVSRMTRGRPWLTFKVAHSLDGRVALADGTSRWISGDAAREDAHRLRAEAGAVMVSSSTVLADDPALTVRIEGHPRQPDRVLVDVRGRIPSKATVFAPGARRFLLAGPEAVEGCRARLAPLGVEVLEAPVTADGDLDVLPALARLGQAEINEVLVECGPRFAGVLLGAHVVDEVVAYVTPQFLGPDALPMATLPRLTALSQAPRFHLHDVAPLGDDVRIRLRAQAI